MEPASLESPAKLVSVQGGRTNSGHPHPEIVNSLRLLAFLAEGSNQRSASNATSLFRRRSRARTS